MMDYSKHVDVWRSMKVERPSHPDILDNPEGRRAVENILLAYQPFAPFSSKKIDRNEFRADLNSAVTMGFENPARMGKSGTAADKRAVAILKKMGKAAEELRDGIGNGEVWERLGPNYAADPGGTLLGLSSAISQTIEEIESVRLGYGAGRSPMEYFVGVFLTSIYQKYLKTDGEKDRPTFMRNAYSDATEAQGAFIDMALQVMAEYGIEAATGPYKPEAIAKAMRKKP